MLLQTILSNELLVNAGTIVVVAGGVGAAAWRFSSVMWRVNSTLERLDATLKDKMDYDNLLAWVRLMRAANPTMEVPHLPEKHK